MMKTWANRASAPGRPSVIATVADLVFLAIAWEFLGKPQLQTPLWLRSFLTLLGVMCLDVLLFTTGAFLGGPAYFEILTGTLLSRLLITVLRVPDPGATPQPSVTTYAAEEVSR